MNLPVDCSAHPVSVAECLLRDIDTGQLAAVLQLLYALSTFKQQVRQKRKEERLEKATTAPPPSATTASAMPPSTASK
ncbi:hypothetical protein Q1695_012518 [Nippostrongylus brasiliensis]|nr:hypothetical protein Q1695_012518 [Nippostrongylus brasiliensis]